jgi:hypothetical protein
MFHDKIDDSEEKKEKGKKGSRKRQIKKDGFTDECRKE